MNFKRLGSFVCVALVAAALVVPRPAHSYTILGGLGGSGGGGLGSGSSTSTYVIAYFVVVAVMLGIMPARGADQPRYPFAPENFTANDDPFGALTAYAGRGKVNDAYAKMYTKAPPQVVQWSGFYVNANVGYGDTRATWRDPFGDIAGVPGDRLNVKGDGVLGGVRAGYEKLYGRYILGIEGEFSGSGMGGSNTRLLPPAVATFRSDMSWVASVTPRVGLVGIDPFFGRTIIAYAKGGVAFAEHKNSFVLNGAAGPFIFPEQSKTSVGWTVGIGTETGLGKGWWFRSDTSYYDFGRERYNFAHPVFGPARTDINNRALVSTIGLTYRFR